MTILCQINSILTLKIPALGRGFSPLIKNMGPILEPLPPAPNGGAIEPSLDPNESCSVQSNRWYDRLGPFRPTNI